MIKQRNEIYKKWFITSYTDKKSALVAGLRCERLQDYLQNKGESATLISCKKSLNNSHVFVKSTFEDYSGIFKTFGAFSPIDHSLLWAFKVSRLLKKKEPSILLTSMPPYGVGLAGLLAKIKNPKHYWIVDFRDPWTISRVYRPIFSLYKMFFAHYLEKLMFKYADLILLNTDTDRKNYLKRYSFIENKVLTIRNGFDNFIENKHKRSVEKIIKIVYTGGAYPKGSAAVGIICFLEEINKGKLLMRCDYYGEFHASLNNCDYISYKGQFGQKEIPEILSHYRMGIIYLQPVCIDGGRMTQKFYDYIGSGVLPIVINPSMEMRKHLESLAIGIGVLPEDDINIIAAKIETQYLSEDQINGKDLITYSRSHQFDLLYARLLNDEKILKDE